MAIDQREALIAAVRAQVEREKAAKVAKQEKERITTGKVDDESENSDSKPKYKTLSKEDMEKIEKKKQMKRAAEMGVDLQAEETSSSDTPKEEKVEDKKVSLKEKISVAKEPEKKNADLGLSVGLQPDKSGKSLDKPSLGGLGNLNSGAYTKQSGIGLGLGVVSSGESQGLGLELGADDNKKDDTVKAKIDISVKESEKEKVKPSSKSGIDLSRLQATKVEGTDSKVKIIGESKDEDGTTHIKKDGDTTIISDSVSWKASETSSENKTSPDDIISIVPNRKTSTNDVKSMYDIDDEDDDVLGAEISKLAGFEEANNVADTEAINNAKLEAEQKAKAEEEKKRVMQEEIAKAKSEEARKKAEAEAEKRKAAEEAAIRKSEQQRKKLAEAEKRAEDQARRIAEARSKARNEEVARQKAEEAARVKAEEEAKRKEIEEQRQKAAAEARKKAEEEAIKKAKADADKAIEDARKKVKDAEVHLEEILKSEADITDKFNKAIKSKQDIEANEKETIARISKEVESRNVEMKTSVDKYNAELEQKAKAASDKASEQDNKVIAQKEQNLKAHTNKKQDLENDIKLKRDAFAKEKQAAINALDNERTSLIKEKKQADEKLAGLKKGISDAEAAVEEAKKKLLEAEENLEKLKSSEKDINTSVNEVDLKLQTVDKSKSEKITEFEKKEKDMNSSDSEAIKEIDEKISSEQADIEKAKKELLDKRNAAEADCKKENEKELEKFIADVNAKNEEAALKDNELKAKLSEDKKSIEKDIADIEKDLNDTKVKAESARKALEEAKAIEVAAVAALDKAADIKIDFTKPVEEGKLPVAAYFLEKYLRVDKAGQQIIESFNSVVGNPTDTRNIVILGEHGFGSTAIGEDFARSFYEMKICDKKTIAKIKASALNKVKLADALVKLKGGCLVVENAGQILPEKLVELNSLSAKNINDFIIILTGEIESVGRLMNNTKELSNKFKYSIKINSISNDEMLDIVKGYIKQLGYSCDEKVEGVVKKLLMAMETGNIDRILKSVDDAVIVCDEREKSSGLANRKKLLGEDFK